MDNNELAELAKLLAYDIYRDFETMVQEGYTANPLNLVRCFQYRGTCALKFDECDIGNPEVFLFAIANDLCENLTQGGKIESL